MKRLELNRRDVAERLVEAKETRRSGSLVVATPSERRAFRLVKPRGRATEMADFIENRIRATP